MNAIWQCQASTSSYVSLANDSMETKHLICVTLLGEASLLVSCSGAFGCIFRHWLPWHCFRVVYRLISIKVECKATQK